MDVTVRNVASVFKRRGNGTSSLPKLEPIHDSGYSDMVAALYSRAVDIWQYPQANATDTRFMHFWNFDAARTGNYDDPWIPWHRANFNTKLKTSPLLVIDETLSPSIIGMHLRGQWEGEFQDFDPRRQVLAMNKRVSLQPVSHQHKSRAVD